MTPMRTALLCLAVSAALLPGVPVRAEPFEPREVRVVGASAAYPLAVGVARALLPRGVLVTVEPTGTAAGLALFCEEDAPNAAPVVLTSREASAEELAACVAAGHDAPIRVVLGHEAVVVIDAAGDQPIALTPSQLLLALAEEVADPDQDCALVPNRARRWAEVDPALPDRPIRVYGPPPRSRTRTALVDLVLRIGAADTPCYAALAKLDPDGLDRAVSRLRSDGAWRDAGGNPAAVTLAVRHLPNALGVVSFLDLTRADGAVAAVPIGGIAPSAEEVTRGRYAPARSLYAYAHPSALEADEAAAGFWEAITTAAAADQLAEAGLVPPPSVSVAEAD